MDSLIKAHPDVGSLRVGRAQVEAHLGRMADAQADFAAARGATGVNATEASVLCNGEVQAKTDPAFALQDCSRAMRAAPRNPVFVVDRAIAANRLGLKAQASADVATLRGMGGDAQDLNSACYALAEAGLALTDALSLCDEAVRLKPDDANILDSRAFTLLRLNRDAEALAVYSAALRIRPDYSAALYGRTIVEARLGRRAESERDKALSKAPSLKPRFADLGVAF